MMEFLKLWTIFGLFHFWIFLLLFGLTLSIPEEEREMEFWEGVHVGFILSIFWPLWWVLLSRVLRQQNV